MKPVRGAEPLDKVLGELGVKWDTVGGKKVGRVSVSAASDKPRTPLAGIVEAPRWAATFATWVDSWWSGLLYWATRAGAVFGWLIFSAWLVTRCCSH